MEHQACDAGNENSDATNNVDASKGSSSLDYIAFLEVCHPLLGHLDDVDDLLGSSWLFHLGRDLIWNNLMQIQKVQILPYTHDKQSDSVQSHHIAPPFLNKAVHN